MTSLEKQSKVKDVLFRMCGYGDGCPDCWEIKLKFKNRGKDN